MGRELIAIRHLGVDLNSDRAEMVIHGVGCFSSLKLGLVRFPPLLFIATVVNNLPLSAAFFAFFAFFLPVGDLERENFGCVWMRLLNWSFNSTLRFL